MSDFQEYTVGSLIEELSKLPQDLRVHISVDCVTTRYFVVKECPQSNGEVFIILEDL